MENKITELEISNLNKEIDSLEKEIYNSYAELGKLILETTENEGRKINCLVDKIIEKKIELHGKEQ